MQQGGLIMNRKWFLGVIAVVLTAVVGGGLRVMAQDANKDKDKHEKEESSASKDARAKARAEHLAAFKKAFEASKTSLSQAIAAAEAVTSGKAFEAQMETHKDGKLGIQVVLFAGEKIMIASVDPETGKATAKEHREG